MEISFKIIKKMMHAGGGLIHKMTNQSYLIINPYSKEEKVMYVTENSVGWPEPFPENIEDYIRIPSLFHGYIAKRFLIHYQKDFRELIQLQGLERYLLKQYPPFIDNQYPEEIYKNGTKISEIVLFIAEENGKIKRMLKKYEMQYSNALILEWCREQDIDVKF